MTEPNNHPGDTKDYRKRYTTPLSWAQDENSTFGIDYAGYIDIVLHLLAEFPPCDVLDAGCGDGRVASKLLTLGHRVVGFDYAERAVAFARVFVPDAEFHTRDLRDLDPDHEPQFRERFDVVLLIETIEHIPINDQVAVLRHLKRLLKPTGRLILSVPSVHLPSNEWHYKHFTLGDIIHLLYDAGFGVERVLFQHRISGLFTYPFWGFIHNRYYDLTFLRKWLRRWFLATYNVARTADEAGRYVMVARCVGATALVPQKREAVPANPQPQSMR